MFYSPIQTKTGSSAPARPAPHYSRLMAVPSVVALLGAMGGAPMALAQTATPAILYGCVLTKEEGKFRIVSATQACKKNETRIQWVSTGPVKGPTGDAGPSGPAGPVGPPGANGATGPMGPNGAPGARGATGTTGAAGVAGTPGSTGSVGIAGPAGPQGATGAAGAAGGVGPMGPQGATGSAGLQGPAGIANTTAGAAGAIGPMGPAGSAGPAGLTGAQGLQGPVGAMTIGPQGIASTTQGPTGPAGALAPSGTISGSLTTCNAQGQPITAPAGTLVYIPGRAFTAATNAAGAFQFDYVPAGTYSVAVETGGTTIVTNSNNVAVASAGVNLGTIAACAPVTPPGGDGGGSSVCGVCSDPTPICNIWEAPYNQCVMCVNNNECYDPLASECIGNVCEGLGF